MPPPHATVFQSPTAHTFSPCPTWRLDLQPGYHCYWCLWKVTSSARSETNFTKDLSGYNQSVAWIFLALIHFTNIHSFHNFAHRSSHPITIHLLWQLVLMEQRMNNTLLQWNVFNGTQIFTKSYIYLTSHEGPPALKVHITHWSLYTDFTPSRLCQNRCAYLPFKTMTKHKIVVCRMNLIVPAKNIRTMA